MLQTTLQFLGSGDIFGSGGRFQTCFYVQSLTAKFLIDCGASTMVAMRCYQVKPNDVDFILLTHLHGDHFGGLPFFILDAQLNSRRQKPLLIAGPSGVESRVRQAMEIFFPGSSTMPLRFLLEFIEWQAHTMMRVGSVEIRPYPVIHPSGATSFALKVRCGDKNIGYSGDTQWTDALIEVAQNTDLFICEAYFFDKRVKYHLGYRTLLAHRTELGCKRLVMTHMHEDLLSRLAEVEIEWAEDGKVIPL